MSGVMVQIRRCKVGQGLGRCTKRTILGATTHLTCLARDGGK
uniref:Uncharacterized protein n=1 Tax=Anopheles albimanus TaxID=7167 RepID=A0A182FXI3_ANOAL